jgi:hypothetical protein
VLRPLWRPQHLVGRSKTIRLYSRFAHGKRGGERVGHRLVPCYGTQRVTVQTHQPTIDHEFISATVERLALLVIDSEHMAAPTDPANVKKALANAEPVLKQKRTNSDMAEATR